MTIGKVFRSGNSQAVRLPKEYRFDTDEVEIRRDGASLVLTPRTRSYGDRLVELFAQLGDGMELPEDLPPQERTGL